MASALSLADLESLEAVEPDEPWFIEPRDRSDQSERARQIAFVSWMRVHAPEVRIMAVPNGYLRTDWQRTTAKREGVSKGALDLWCFWSGNGRHVSEWKDGTGMPDADQRAWLNFLYRDGYPCGVYRNRATLIGHLIDLGAPIVGRLGV